MAPHRSVSFLIVPYHSLSFPIVLFRPLLLPIAPYRSFVLSGVQCGEGGGWVLLPDYLSL